MIIDIIKVITPAALAFMVGIGITPILTHYLYKYKAWKKSGHKTALDGKKAVVFTKLREHVETNTPRMGGVVVWMSTLIVVLGIWLLSNTVNGPLLSKLDFLSRDQTWIPLFTLMAGAILGLFNDILDITSPTGERGIPLKIRLLFIALISLFIGWWFYDKLEIVSIAIPFGGELVLGYLIIPLFMLVTLALYASGVIDGIDGLSGAVFSSIFGAYAFIAYAQDQINLAAFCATLVGALLAFLWFNIPPARFWMTETGTMGLTITIAVVAFMTDTLGEGIGVSALPIVGFILVVTVLSNIIQVLSKKFRGKKIFLVAPLHHHFEALGWPGYKVTMRYWVLSIIFGILGVIVALIN